MAWTARRLLSALAGRKRAPLEVGSARYEVDDYTNVTPKILSYVGRDLHLAERHPLGLVRRAVADHFREACGPGLVAHDRLGPVVTPEQNFDSLLVAADHPSRSRRDCYYLNRGHLLRAHTTAHQSELLRAGCDDFLVAGDVYRRDDIDAAHFPVFHQMDAVRTRTRAQLLPGRPELRLFEGDSRRHTREAVAAVEALLKGALEGLARRLFGGRAALRWVDAHFPFTRPSWELEVLHAGAWTEVLGCGVVRDEILARAGRLDVVAYAFGLGLERVAMVRYGVPDIRLFWSRDSGFLGQFERAEPADAVAYRPLSVYPQCRNDLSFFLPPGVVRDDFSDSDFYDLVREVGGDVVEQVKCADAFVHPKSGLTSLTYKIVYRHMERTLTKKQANAVHDKIVRAAEARFNVVPRL